MGWPFKNILNIGKTVEKAVPTVTKTSEALPTAVKSITTAQPVVSTIKPVVQAYQIQHLPGYQLKSLMSGNPLEKQLSKTGTISTASIDALSKKMSAVEQAVIGKVLTEKFSGQKAIDYNDFRKGVQDELITYDRTPSTEYENYGIDRLGFKFADPGGLSIAGWDDLIPNTFTFSSPRIPIGNGRHYDINTLGHSRTFTTSNEPDVLHIMESQSDAAQAGRKAFDKFSTEYLNDPKEYQKFIDRHKNLLAEMEAHPEEYLDGAAEKQRKNIAEHERALKAILTKINPIDEIQAQHLMDVYPIRQLQENLRYAAERGQGKMRYPTRETAAKIEGYPEREAYYDASGKDVTTDKSVDLFDYHDDGRLTEINNRESEICSQMDYLQSNLWEGEEKADAQRLMAELDRELSKLMKEKQSIIDNAELKPGFTKKVVYDNENILKRYSDFPKQFGKLFKGAPVRTTQDLHGNTWYEVDVPKDYLKMEWPYKDGGNIPSIFKEGGIIKAQEGKGLNDAYEQWKAKQKHPVYSYSKEPWQEKYMNLVKNLLSETESTRSDNTQDIYNKEPIVPATPEQIQYYNDNIKFVTDYNRENNTNFENRDQIQQYEEATRPGWNMVINVPAMYGTATGAGNTQIWDPKNRVPSTVGTEISQVTIPLTFALAGGAAGTIPQLLTNGAFYIEAAKNFSSPEGITKTKNLLSEEKYGKAALSGLGDALDLSIMLGGSGSAIRAAKNVANLRKLMALKTVPMQELKSIGYNIPAVAYNNGGIMKTQKGKVLKSLSELEPLQKDLFKDKFLWGE